MASETRISAYTCPGVRAMPDGGAGIGAVCARHSAHSANQRARGMTEGISGVMMASSEATAEAMWASGMSEKKVFGKAAVA